VSYTKREIVEAAFEEIGLSEYVFDLQPQQLESALRRLDAMMATWNGRGIRLGYPLPSSPTDSDLDEDSYLPDAANEAAITNLAIRIAPSYGKTPSAETKSAAKIAYDLLLSKAAHPIEMQLPSTMPRGAGNKPFADDNPFFGRPADPVLAGEDGPIDFY